VRPTQCGPVSGGRTFESYVFFFRRTTRPFSPPVMPSWTPVPIAPSASHANGTHCCPGAGFMGYITQTF